MCIPSFHFVKPSILNGAPVFSLANRGMQIQSTIVLQKSTKQVRAVALRLSQTANVTPECNETNP